MVPEIDQHALHDGIRVRDSRPAQGMERQGGVADVAGGPTDVAAAIIQGVRLLLCDRPLGIMDQPLHFVGADSLDDAPLDRFAQRRTDGVLGEDHDIGVRINGIPNRSPAIADGDIGVADHLDEPVWADDPAVRIGFRLLLQPVHALDKSKAGCCPDLLVRVGCCLILTVGASPGKNRPGQNEDQQPFHELSPGFVTEASITLEVPKISQNG